MTGQLAGGRKQLVTEELRASYRASGDTNKGHVDITSPRAISTITTPSLPSAHTSTGKCRFNQSTQSVRAAHNASQTNPSRRDLPPPRSIHPRSWPVLQELACPATRQQRLRRQHQPQQPHQHRRVLRSVVRSLQEPPASL